MGLFSSDSDVSIRTRKLSPAAILNLSSVEKANLACEIVQAKKNPGDSEKKALIHLFAYLKPADFISEYDRSCTNHLNKLIKSDKELMRLAVKGWGTADDQCRISILKRVIGYHSMAFCISTPTLIFRDFPKNNSFGSFDPNSGVVKFDIRDDHGWSNLSDLDLTILTALHEPTHRYQIIKIIPMADTAYATAVTSQARLFWANSKCYIEKSIWGIKAYENQPLERHARAISEMGANPVKQIREQEKQKVLKETLRVLQ